MSGAWQFLACNALTNQPISELPLRSASFTRVLNDSGQFQADIALDDPNITKLGLVTQGAVEPARVAIYCLRDGAMVWGGILWGHTYDSSTAILSLRAAEFGSYLAFRFITSSNTFTGDMSTLSANWVTAAFADAGPPLTTLVQTCGINQTIVTQAWEQHNILDLVKAFHTAVGGYDWAFDIVPDTNRNPSARFTLSAPRRGVSYVNSGVVYDYPGPVIAYNVQRDGDLLMSDLFAAGAGTGTSQISVEVTKASFYLKMQAVANNTDLTTQVSLAAWAGGLMKVFGDPPPQAVKCTVTGDAFYSTGLSVGDEITLQVNDPYLVGSYAGRIIQHTTKPPTDGTPEVVDLVLGAPL